MEQKIQNLMLLLERMTVLYGRVLEILARERQHLIEMDFESLYEVMREKDEVHSVLRSLDEDRLRIQDQFALIMDRDTKDLSLKILIEDLKEQLPLEAKRLGQLRTEMAMTIEAVTDKILSNKYFIERSVENLQLIASNLSQAIRGASSPSKGKDSVYTGRAKLNNPKGKSGSIVEKRF